MHGKTCCLHQAASFGGLGTQAQWKRGHSYDPECEKARRQAMLKTRFQLKVKNPFVCNECHSKPCARDQLSAFYSPCGFNFEGQNVAGVAENFSNSGASTRGLCRPQGILIAANAAAPSNPAGRRPWLNLWDVLVIRRLSFHSSRSCKAGVTAADIRRSQSHFRRPHEPWKEAAAHQKKPSAEATLSHNLLSTSKWRDMSPARGLGQSDKAEGLASSCQKAQCFNQSIPDPSSPWMFAQNICGLFHFGDEAEVVTLSRWLFSPAANRS